MTKIQRLLALWQWRSLWTSEKHDWFLIRTSAQAVDYSIYRNSDDSLLFMEDDDLYMLIIEEMLKAGNLIVEMDDFVNRRGSVV